MVDVGWVVWIWKMSGLFLSTQIKSNQLFNNLLTLFQHGQHDSGYGRCDGAVGQLKVFEHFIRQDKVFVLHLGDKRSRDRARTRGQGGGRDCYRGGRWISATVLVSSASATGVGIAVEVWWFGESCDGGGGVVMVVTGDIVL